MSEISTTAERPEGQVRRVIVGLIQMSVVVALLITAAVFSRGPSEEDVLEDAGYVANNPGGDVLTTVRVIRPQYRDVQVSLESTGTVRVRAVVRLVPQVSGRVTWISENSRSGGSFRANEILLKIDDEDFRLNLAQAEANLASAQANLELQQAESDSATANWKLLNPNTDAPKLVAKIPQMNITRALIESAQVQVKTAELNLRRTQFSVPFSGRVIESDAAVGQLTSVGQSFGSAYDIESVEVAIPLSQEELSMIEPAKGRNITVISNGVQQTTTVDRVSSQLDSRSRVATIYATLPVSSLYLPGTFVEVDIEGKLHQSVFQLPDRTEQSYGAFWVVRSGRLEKVEPTVLARMHTGIAVESFNFGQGVVIGTLSSATAGQAVNVISEES